MLVFRLHADLHRLPKNSGTCTQESPCYAMPSADSLTPRVSSAVVYPDKPNLLPIITRHGAPSAQVACYRLMQQSADHGLLAYT